MIEPTPLAGVKKEDGREERASRPGYDADWPYCANVSMPRCDPLQQAILLLLLPKLGYGLHFFTD